MTCVEKEEKVAGKCYQEQKMQKSQNKKKHIKKKSVLNKKNWREYYYCCYLNIMFKEIQYIKFALMTI